MMYYIAFLLIVSFIAIFHKPLTQAGGVQLSFSDKSEDISDGNKASWSKRKNLPRDFPESTKNSKLTFMGHGSPLAHETRLGKFYGQTIPTISRKNYRCSPDCCPSQFSCDDGCVCDS